MNEIAMIVQKIVESHYDYLSECERNSTLQQEKLAELTIATKELAANREIMNQYYVNHFDEQKQLYDSANKVLEVAIQRGDPNVAEITLQVIKLIHNRNFI